MKRMLLFVAAVFPVLAQQAAVLAPVAEFDLSGNHRQGRNARPYFSANSQGLTLVMIGEAGVTLTTADPDGRIRHVKKDLASAHAQIYGALPLPDGNVWLLSSGPHGLSEGFGVFTDLGSALPASPSPGRGSMRPANDTRMDLYSNSGENIESLQLLALVGGSGSPVAAGNDQLVLRGTMAPGFNVSGSQLIHFGSVADGRFKERTQVRLKPPVTGGIPLLAGNGDLVLIERNSGNMVVIDPKTKSGSVVRLQQPRGVRAAAADGEFLYLLSGDTLLKTDVGGQAIGTYRLQNTRGFEAFALGVAADSLYLVDRSGRTEKFRLY